MRTSDKYLLRASRGQATKQAKAPVPQGLILEQAGVGGWQGTHEVGEKEASATGKGIAQLGAAAGRGGASAA